MVYMVLKSISFVTPSRNRIRKTPPFSPHCSYSTQFKLPAGHSNIITIIMTALVGRSTQHCRLHNVRSRNSLRGVVCITSHEQHFRLLPNSLERVSQNDAPTG